MKNPIPAEDQPGNRTRGRIRQWPPAPAGCDVVNAPHVRVFVAAYRGTEDDGDVPSPEVDIQIRVIEARKGNITGNVPSELRDVKDELTGFWNYSKYEVKYKVHMRAMEQSTVKIEFGEGVGLEMKVLKINKLVRNASFRYELYKTLETDENIASLLPSSFQLADNPPELLEGSKVYKSKGKPVFFVFNMKENVKTLLTSSFIVSEEIPEVLGGSRLYKNKDIFVLLVFKIKILPDVKDQE